MDRTRGRVCEGWGGGTSDFVNHAGQSGLRATWPRQAPAEVCFGWLQLSITPVIDRFLSSLKVSRIWENQVPLAWGHSNNLRNSRQKQVCCVLQQIILRRRHKKQGKKIIRCNEMIAIVFFFLFFSSNAIYVKPNPQNSICMFV